MDGHCSPTRAVAATRTAAGSTPAVMPTANTRGAAIAACKAPPIAVR